MMSRIYHWILLMCCVMCIAFAKDSGDTASVNFLTIINDGLKESRTTFGEKKIDEERSSLIEFDMNFVHWISSRSNWMDKVIDGEEKFSAMEKMLVFVETQCSRYCIERNISQNNHQFINFNWSLNGTFTNGLNTSTSTRFKSGNLNGELKNCQIYLDLNCNPMKIGSAANYVEKQFHPNHPNNIKNENSDSNTYNNSDSTISIKLVEKEDLSKDTEIKFLVDKSMSQIVVNVKGNISFALLRIPADATVSWSGTVISLESKTDAEGMKIDTQNAPPGEWWMKLIGEENSKYRFTAEALVHQGDNVPANKSFVEDKLMKDKVPERSFDNLEEYETNIKITDDIIFNDKADDLMEVAESKHIKADGNWDEVANKRLLLGRKITQRSLEDPPNNERSVEMAIEKSNSPISLETSAVENGDNEYTKYSNYVNEKNATALRNPSNNNKNSSIIFITEENEDIQSKSSIGSTEDFDLSRRTIKFENSNISMRIEALDDRELSEELTTNINEDSIETKRMLIDINRNTNLLVTPGTIHRVLFDVINSCILPVRYVFRVKSSSFRIYNIQPSYVWVYPGQTNNVAVDLIVPNNVSPNTANTLTLSIQGTEIKEKSVNLYVQGSFSKITDDVKPTMEYSFNNNCAGKLGKDRCSKSRWSADITIQDEDSGLKRVISSPNEIYPRTDFVSGTRNPITFYYSSTCCDTTAKITAIDLLDNSNTRTIDVAVWNNLSDAEIAAITVGALLILLLIILVVLIIIYCFQRKKSHDLPYTQRYGSRPPAQAERTSF